MAGSTDDHRAMLDQLGSKGFVVALITNSIAALAMACTLALSVTVGMNAGLFIAFAGCRSKAVTWAAEPGWAVGPGAGEVPGGSVRAAAGRPEP